MVEIPPAGQSAWDRRLLGSTFLGSAQVDDTIAVLDPHAEIARLEAEIEERSEAIERCRKVILISKVAALGGALAIALLFVGFIRPDATLLVIAIAAVLGGVVGLGSTTTTAGQLAAALKDAEARRAQLIGMIDLTVVGDEPG